MFNMWYLNNRDIWSDGFMDGDKEKQSRYCVLFSQVIL